MSRTWRPPAASSPCPPLPSSGGTAELLPETPPRRAVEPAKMNLASLGNQVPHLHWHVIGRWPDDPHFPASVWSAPVRAVEPDRHRTRRRAVDAALPSIRDALSRDAAG